MLDFDEIGKKKKEKNVTQGNQFAAFVPE